MNSVYLIHHLKNLNLIQNDMLIFYSTNENEYFLSGKIRLNL